MRNSSVSSHENAKTDVQFIVLKLWTSIFIFQNQKRKPAVEPWKQWFNLWAAASWSSSAVLWWSSISLTKGNIEYLGWRTDETRHFVLIRIESSGPTEKVKLFTAQTSSQASTWWCWPVTWTIRRTSSFTTSSSSSRVRSQDHQSILATGCVSKGCRTEPHLKLVAEAAQIGKKT